jgi:hypothetical protein
LLDCHFELAIPDGSRDVVANAHANGFPFQIEIARASSEDNGERGVALPQRVIESTAVSVVQSPREKD